MAKSDTSADGNVKSTDNEKLVDAAHDGSDGTIPTGGPSVADRDNVDADALIADANDAAKVDEHSTELRSEADFGDSGNKRTLRTKGSYMIQDPTTGVEINQEAREVSFSAFLQRQLDLGLIEEA